MCKKVLREQQMTSAEYVVQAATWSKELTRVYTRGPGDLDNAMVRVEREFGIAYATLWALRYRLPKSIDIAIFVRIWSAWRQCCERQRERLDHELAVTRLVCGVDDPAVVSVEALLGETPATPRDAEDVSE